MHRRDILAGAAALALAPAATWAAEPADARLMALLARHAAALQGGDRLEAFPDRSAAGRAALVGGNAARLRELAAIDRATLSPEAQLEYDTARFVYTTLDDLYRRPGHVDLNLRPNAYVATQMSGYYYWLPDGIGAGAPTTDAYLAKLDGFARILDQEMAQIAEDAARGVVPPSFVLAKTIAQLKMLRDAPLASNRLTGPVVATKPALAPRAEASLRATVVPAISRQIAALEVLLPRATDIAGVWHLPDGEAYYAVCCRSNTTTSLTPAELHAVGLDLVAKLTAETDTALRKQGLTSGSVAERIIALGNDPRVRLPETDDSRVKILAAGVAQVAKARAHLPRGFTIIPADPLLVKRISPAIEAGAPGAYYNDGGPGNPPAFYVNLHEVAETPLWRLGTLVAHEGIPGHHFQYSAQRMAGGLPPFRRTVKFSAYTEGWAHYAERLSDEIGVYEDDPFGRIGMLQAQLFRACRIAVDTGIHYKRWTRQAAIDWMVANGGEAPSYAEREIDRYCVYPGQACSFKIGQERLHAARERARQRLGSRFDLRLYNDLILARGPYPMDVLDTMVDRWDGSPVRA